MAGPFYSDQITDVDQSTPARLVKPNELRGRARTYYFSYKTPASGAPAVGEVVQLVKVPKGARVLGLYLNWEALTSAGGTAGADIGDGGDADRFIAALNMDAAGEKAQGFRLDNSAREPALGFGYEYTVEDTIDATVTGEAWAISKYVRGYFIAVID